MKLNFRKKLKIGILNFFVLIISQQGFANDYGAGFVLGSPSALSGKIYVNPETAYDMGLGFSSGDYMLFFADYLRHYPKSGLFKDAKVSGLSPYIGIGALVAVTTATRSSNDKYLGTSSGSFGLGLRVPFGLEWKLNSPPLGFFAEIAPGLSVMPSTDTMVNVGLGIRYLF